MPMQSRTDQVHSYEFFLQRIISGLVARESDPAELPFRRLGWSGFGSVMIAIVVAAVFGIIGALRGGGNDSWQEGDSIIEEKGSNNIYLYIGDKLHPMENLVSAQLAKPGADVEQVSTRSLEGVPRGTTLGIRDLPHTFPDADNLVRDPWTLCSQEQLNERGQPETISVLGVGVQPVGGQPAGDQAVLVHDPIQDTYHMVWHGYRFAIDPELQDETLAALSIEEVQATPVLPAWLNAVPPGKELVPPSVAAVGEPVTVGNNAEVETGDVVHDGRRWLLVDSDGLLQLTTIEVEILRSLGVAEHEVSLSGIENIEALPPPGDPTSPPQDLIPTFLLGRSACLIFRPGEFDPVVVVRSELDEAAANETPRQGERGDVFVDYVHLPGGAAVLVQSMSSPGAPGGPWYVVNDQGIAFAMTDASVVGMLGYEAGQQVRMSSGLVGLLPPGPDLDPAVAGAPVSGSASTPGPEG